MKNTFLKLITLLLVMTVVISTLVACDVGITPTEAPANEPTEAPTGSLIERPTNGPAERPTEEDYDVDIDGSVGEKNTSTATESAPPETPDYSGNDNISGQIPTTAPDTTATESPETAVTEAPTEMPTEAPETCDGLEFTSNGDKTCYVSGIGSCGYEPHIVIPPVSPAGDTVVAIGDGALEGCHRFYTLVIPDSVKTIGERAFADCYGLRIITVGTGVERIGEDAFVNCGSLEELHVGSIESWAQIDFVGEYYSNPMIFTRDIYLNGEEVTNLVINDVPSISKNAFKYCQSITSVEIGGSVEIIGEGAFYDCDNLRSLTIGNGVKEICKEAFYHCNCINALELPESVEILGERAFSNCSILNLVVSDEITSIGVMAFYLSPVEEFTGPARLLGWISNGNLVRVTITSGDTIGSNGLKYCAIREIYIPACVTRIESNAFYQCDYLTIYCEVTEQPVGWAEDWNATNCPVVWGYVPEE